MEDYTRARTFATIEHLGVTFHISRERRDGKPWRGYLTLVHEGVAVVAEVPRVSDPADTTQVERYYRGELERIYPDTPEGRSELVKRVALMHMSHHDAPRS